MSVAGGSELGNVHPNIRILKLRGTSVLAIRRAD